MSQENVDTVRASLEAFAAGGLDAIAAYWDPDIVHHAIEGAPDDVGEMRGAAALRRYMQDWIDTFEQLTLVLEEVRDLGDDRVLATQCVSGRAKLSGAETELHYAIVYTLRDGRIVRGQEYIDLPRALEAEGLSA